MNYQIYKIEPMKNGADGDIFIGYTTLRSLHQCLSKKRNDYDSWKNGTHNNNTCYQIFDKYGINKCKIILLENIQCESKDQLYKRVVHYIETLKCVNKSKPGTGKTPEERLKIKQQQIIEENKRIKDLNDKLNEKKKKKQEYRKQTLTCECGCEITRSSKFHHLKSKKHIEFIKLQNLLDV
jgi:hypothetical protein